MVHDKLQSRKGSSNGSISPATAFPWTSMLLAVSTTALF